MNLTRLCSNGSCVVHNPEVDSNILTIAQTSTVQSLPTCLRRYPSLVYSLHTYSSEKSTSSVPICNLGQKLTETHLYTWTGREVGCTNTWHRFAPTTKFWTVEPNIFGFSVCNPFHITILAPKLFIWLQDFGEFLHPCSCKLVQGADTVSDYDRWMTGNGFGRQPLWPIIFQDDNNKYFPGIQIRTTKSIHH
jgi:hypothetical protein